MRTIIDLEATQASRLDAWAKAQKVSRAVNQMLERAAQPQGTGFGLWAQGQAVPPERDGLALQRALRDEWPA
jgi:hypothetical protein